jgi:hypothetical protein
MGGMVEASLTGDAFQGEGGNVGIVVGSVFVECILIVDY